MNPKDPLFSDEETEDPGEITDDETQRRIAAMLHRSAADDGPTARMPSSVEARIREALQAERPVMAGETSPSGSGPSHVAPLPRTRHEAPTSIQLPGAAAPRRETPTSSTGGATVHSLDAQRRRRPRAGRIALALGAAAAVAIGTVGVVHSREGGSSTPAVAAAAPSVRVTDSRTSYTPAGLKEQAAALPGTTAQVISSEHQASAAGLGPLATTQGVRSCVEAIGAAVTDKPDKVWADFGTYDGHKAVVVLVDKGGRRTVWVVGRSCTTKSDVLTGPTALQA